MNPLILNIAEIVIFKKKNYLAMLQVNLNITDINSLNIQRSREDHIVLDIVDLYIF